MYHDGTNWVDKSFVFVEAMTNLSDVTISNEATGQSFDTMAPNGSIQSLTLMTSNE